jgi:rhodanese-related sulfurtransferase
MSLIWEPILNKISSYLFVFIMFFSLTPGVYAADTDYSKQPSTERVISHADLKKVLAQPDSAVILDLRRDSDYDKDTVSVPSARRLHPDKIAEWSGSLPKDKEILLFCAHGRSISNASVDYLTKNGYKARLIAGGIDGWRDAGGVTAPKPN